MRALTPPSPAAAHGPRCACLFVMGAAVPRLHGSSPALASKPFAALASCVCSRSNWLRLPLRRGDAGRSHGVRWSVAAGRTGGVRHCHSVCSSATVPTRLYDGVAEDREDFNFDGPISLQGENGSEELVNQSRRSVVQTGAALALLVVLDCLPGLAEPAQSEPEAVASQESVQAETKPEKSRVDMESWYRVRGQGFALSVPPNYEDVVEYDESGNSLYGERAKDKPFLARFASPDRKEVLSVIARNGSQLKLSFFETQDITEFGSLEEAAKIFVPAGSKIVAAATRKPPDSRVPRTYYLYEFLAKDDKHVVMSAAAAGGRVFVFGAMAPNSRWEEVGSTMRSAALNFALR